MCTEIYTCETSCEMVIKKVYAGSIGYCDCVCSIITSRRDAFWSVRPISPEISFGAGSAHQLEVRGWTRYVIWIPNQWKSCIKNSRTWPALIRHFNPRRPCPAVLLRVCILILFIIIFFFSSLLSSASFVFRRTFEYTCALTKIIADAWHPLSRAQAQVSA